MYRTFISFLYKCSNRLESSNRQRYSISRTRSLLSRSLAKNINTKIRACQRNFKYILQMMVFRYFLPQISFYKLMQFSEADPVLERGQKLTPLNLTIRKTEQWVAKVFRWWLLLLMFYLHAFLVFWFKSAGDAFLK